MAQYAVMRRPMNPYHHPMRRAQEVGAWVATPGWLKEQINKLVGEWNTMGKEITVSMGQEGATEKMRRYREEVWSPMSVRFYEFANGHQSWYQNLWGNTWDTIKEWRQTLIRLRAQAEDAGFYFQAPQPLPPERHPLDTIGTILKWVVGAIIGAAALYLITGLIRAVRAPSYAA